MKLETIQAKSEGKKSVSPWPPWSSKQAEPSPSPPPMPPALEGSEIKKPAELKGFAASQPLKKDFDEKIENPDDQNIIFTEYCFSG